MKSLPRFLLLAALAGSAAGFAEAQAASASPKWFVLRTEQGDSCWTGKLIVIAGQYARGSALIAGGPYDSEDEAKARRCIT